MPGRFPFSKLLKYPHLKADEIAIWERFIDKNPGFFDSVDYDVHVGKAREYPEIPEEKIKKGMEELSRKRIDFVGYKEGKVFIGEIKPFASLGAIGQLIGEMSLWKKEHPEIKKVSCILITDHEVPDMKVLCSEQGIEYFVV
jgi:hypothetical protein